MTQHLMGAREIGQALGLSRQRVQQLLARESFPEPYDELAMGRLWRREDVEGWIARYRPERDPVTGLPRPGPHTRVPTQRTGKGRGRRLE